MPLLPSPLPAALAALACAGLLACQPLVPPGEDVPLREYRDTLLRVDLGYPEGWTSTEKSSFITGGRVHNLFCEPPGTEWTRRFAVRVKAPDRFPAGRTLDDLKGELLGRLAAPPGPVRLDDTAAAILGGEPAFLARYTTFLDGKAFVRHVDIVCLRDGRDVALRFEVADAHAGADIVLFRRIADRFRFDPP